MRPLFPYLVRQWRQLTVIAALTAVSSLIAALQPLPLKLLIDSALGKGGTPGELQWFLRAFAMTPTPGVLVVVAALASLTVWVVSAAVNAVLTWLWSRAGQQMVYSLANDLFARMQRLSLLFHARQPVGDSLNRLTADTWCVYTLTSTLVMSPLERIVTLFSVGWVAWKLDAELALVSLAAAPLLGISTYWFGQRLKGRARRARDAQARVSSFTQRTLTAVPFWQAMTAEEEMGRQFSGLARAAVAEAQGSALSVSGYGMVNGLITTLGMVAVLYLGSVRLLAGTLSAGTLLVFLAYMRTLQRTVEGSLKIYGSWKPLEASVDRVMEVLRSTESLPENHGAVSLPEPGEGERGRVRFESVTFGYEAGRPVLEDVSLETRPGETIALVGRSGAGKSTLAAMIPRFFDPWEGRVLIDGVDTRDLKIESLRSQVALVLQEPFLLPLSVAGNIAYGRPGASREEVVAAAVAANAHEFIQALPEGYDTVIGERGATLSGGEKQRLAIARAVLKNAQVLILDEPTSALDVQTEASVMEALRRLTRGRTTFLLAHRMSTLRWADRIVVMEGGRIAEVGTHDELLAAGGVYWRLWSLQEVA